MGDIVVVDKFGSRKGVAVRAAIEAVGTELRNLPLYNPVFNPIEIAFSQLEAHLRKAAERTREGRWSAIGALPPIVTSQQSANSFTASGDEPC